MVDMVERIAQAMAESNDFCWDYCDKPTWRRDAKLAVELSGAPDLLAALTALRDAVKSVPVMQGREYVQLGIQVNDAIAKAEGRE